jgi:hypothetical protein
LWEYQDLSKAATRPISLQTHTTPEAANMWYFLQPEVSVKAHIIAKHKCTIIIDENVK